MFAWLGSRYTLIFDADRHVPISSESRTDVAGRLATHLVRIRYTAYERVQPGEVARHLRLPPLPASRGNRP